ITIVEDTNGAGNVLTNDTDSDGDVLIASVVTNPVHGIIVLNADGSFTYTPNANFNGIDTVIYQACDNNGGCDTARLVITVTTMNDAPVAVDDAITINEDTQGTGNVLTNDSDPESDALTASVINAPAHGTIIMNVDGSFTYTPNANYNGIDTVTYQVCDNNGACDTARLIIAVTAVNDAPIAADDAVTINEDAQGTGNVLSNDTDPDGDALTASVVTNPAHGTIVLNADGSFTYTPNANFSGIDTLTYQACDNGACDTARLIITVTAVNDAPVAADDAITINEDIQGTGNVLTNDTDPDGDALTASVINAPAHGTIIMNADGSFTYTPNANFNGIDTVSYQACDNNGACDTARLIITVTAMNDAPLAVDDAITINEDTQGTGNVLTNDTDPDGDALTASVVANPAHGTIVLNANGSFTYTPNANFNGIDTVTYQACDNIGACDTALLIITVTAMNDAPIAADDAITINEDIQGTGNVLINDTDPDGNALTASVVTNPAHGTIVLNTDGSFTYTPDANFNGIDTATYQACDNTGACDTARLIITVTPVNDAPIATDDAITIAEDTQGTGNVLTNDTDPEGDVLTASVITSPAHGTIVLNADGSFTYTPNANFNGLDTVTYQACDNNGVCDTARLIITVTAINDAPIATDDAITINEDTQGTGNVLTNDTDPDSDALTASVITSPAHGTIVLNANGTFTYTPNANFNGLDTVTYQACDNTGLCDTARLIITVTPVNDAPIATDDATTINEDTQGTGNVLINDTDPDGDALTASVVTNPAHGTIVLNADGSFTYTPNANFNGIDTVMYQTCDNTSTCDTARLIITVTPVNDAPIATDDAITINEDTQGTGNVLTNDTDPDSDPLTASVITSPAHGTIVLNANGTFTYTPNANFNGLDTVTYKACDNTGLCDTARLIITVTPVNDAPIATDDATTINEDTPGTGNVLINDTDPDGDALTASVVTNPAHGTIVLNTDGSFTYTPNANFYGIDTVMYQACDNTGACDTARLIITVTAMNDAPVAADDAITIAEDTQGTGNVLTNDTDPDSDALTTSVITSPAHGTIVLNANGSFTYLPNANYSGIDSVTYQACDNTGFCDTARLIITITPVNDAPVAQNDNITIPEDATGIGNLLSNDSDVDGDPLSAGIIQGPANGRIVLNANGSFTYIPTSNYDGPDSVIYRVCDNHGACDTAILRITITPAPDAPVATNDSYTMTVNTGVSGNVLNNDYDLDGDALTATMITSPVHGTITFNSDGTFTYKPDQDYVGTDNITYQVCATDGCDTATVTFSIVPLNVSLAGIAKEASNPILNLNGSYDVTYTFVVSNFGNTALKDVQVTDDLKRVFPDPMTFTIKDIIQTTGANLIANNQYNGVSITSLLQDGSTILVGENDTIRFTITIMPNGNFGTFNNSATLTATAVESNAKVTDVSTNGLTADPNGDNDPGEEIPTPVTLNQTQLHIPGGFSPNGDGKNDKFVIGNIGNGTISLEVYNRWGNVVFRDPNYRNTWDGKCNQGIHIGEDLPDGTYFYIVILNGKEKFMSYITIIR
ncbi:Ig-like domain-containing protein, partial [Chitinophaga silvisoli]